MIPPDLPRDRHHCGAARDERPPGDDRLVEERDSHLGRRPGTGRDRGRPRGAALPGRPRRVRQRAAPRPSRALIDSCTRTQRRATATRCGCCSRTSASRTSERAVDVIDRSNRPELLGGLNPALRVPTIVLDDGRALGESNAILWYFGEGTRFVPTDRYERAQVLQWMFFEQYDHEPASPSRASGSRLRRPGRIADRLRRASTQPGTGARRDGTASGRDGRGSSAIAMLARRHRALRVHACRRRGRLRPRPLPGDSRLARACRRAARARSDRRLANQERGTRYGAGVQTHHRTAREHTGPADEPALARTQRCDQPPGRSNLALEPCGRLAAGARSCPHRLTRVLERDVCASGASNAANEGFGLLPSVTSPLWKREMSGSSR